MAALQLSILEVFPTPVYSSESHPTHPAPFAYYGKIQSGTHQGRVSSLGHIELAARDIADDPGSTNIGAS